MKKINFLKLSREFTLPNFFKKNLGGFTLIEVIIAIFLITVGMVGVLIAIQQVFPSIRIVSSQLTAVYLAQEGIEIVRNIRDTNWLNPLNPDWNEGIFVCGGAWSCNCYADYNDSSLTCFGEPPPLKIDGDSYNYDSGTPTSFVREIMVASTTDSEGMPMLKTEVLVTWQVGGKNYQASTTEYLYNWLQSLPPAL
jgi:type II secretory pathway pseudopilin PulG